MIKLMIGENDTVYFYYYDVIDSNRVKMLMSLVGQVIGKEKCKSIYFLFASRGGEVDAGITLYNFFKSLPVEVIMHNIGVINSIANVIFMAGVKRYAAPHTSFLFHGAQSQLSGHFSIPQINEILDSLMKDHDKIAGIIQENSQITKKEIKKLFAQGETKDVHFALKKGVIHKIEIPQVPQNARFITVNING